LVNALDWMTNDHLTHPGQQSVANMSLALNFVNVDVDDAVMRAVGAGITVVVAAGNEQQPVDACTWSSAHLGNPATYAPNPGGASVITVGSSTWTDTIGVFSNTGNCVDIFAPGEQITMANSPSGVRVNSGTSFAAPHVAGVAALHMERLYWIASYPSAIEGIIKDNASVNKLSNVPTGTPNLLLYSLLIKQRACCIP
jgi:subtilisin family serine protease